MGFMIISREIFFQHYCNKKWGFIIITRESISLIEVEGVGGWLRNIFFQHYYCNKKWVLQSLVENLSLREVEGVRVVFDLKRKSALNFACTALLKTQHPV